MMPSLGGFAHKSYCMPSELGYNANTAVNPADITFLMFMFQTKTYLQVSKCTSCFICGRLAVYSTASYDQVY